MNCSYEINGISETNYQKNTTGQIDGIYKINNGCCCIQTTYKNGQKNGPQTTTYKNQLIRLYNYKDDKLFGHCWIKNNDNIINKYYIDNVSVDKEEFLAMTD